MGGLGHAVRLQRRRAKRGFQIVHHPRGGSDALHDRMKRSYSAPAGLAEPGSTRARSNWCSVGTAEYHVTAWSRAIRQNDNGLNLPGTTTVPPVARVASVEATRPCAWVRQDSTAASQEASGVWP